MTVAAMHTLSVLAVLFDLLDDYEHFAIAAAGAATDYAEIERKYTDENGAYYADLDPDESGEFSEAWLDTCYYDERRDEAKHKLHRAFMTVEL